MKKNDIIRKLVTAPKGSIVNVELCSDVSRNIAAKNRDKVGGKVSHLSLVQIQSRIPYTSIKEVREAIEKGERDAPRLPFAASGIDSITDGVIFYTPKTEGKPLLVGFRRVKTLRSKFIDADGNDITDSLKDVMQPGWLNKKHKKKSEHAADGTGEWRTCYETTVLGVGKSVSEIDW